MTNTNTDYGLDAPNVIRNLAIIGIIQIIIGSILISYKLIPNNILNLYVIISLFISGIWCLTSSTLMIFSSKIGKKIQAKRLIDALNLKGNEKILDIGCGRGLILIEAAKRLNNGKAIGIDIWNQADLSTNTKEATLNNCKLEGVLNRIEIKDGDARKLPFPDNTFDVIISSMMLHNIYNQTEREISLCEMLRTLKTGGKLAIQDFQHTKAYEITLIKLGAVNVKRSKLSWYIFPPVRIVTANKT